MRQTPRSHNSNTLVSEADTAKRTSLKEDTSAADRLRHQVFDERGRNKQGTHFCVAYGADATRRLRIRKRQPAEHRWPSFVIFAHVQPYHCHSCLSRSYDPWCVKCGCKTSPIAQAKKKVRFVADPFSEKLRAVITEPDEWPSEPGPVQKKRKAFTKYGIRNTNFAAPFIRQLRREMELENQPPSSEEWPSVKEILQRD